MPQSCCIVGAGPAGMMLGWMLARRGIPVTLLERHEDFERDFRGDTLHPGVLEVLDELGLIDKILELPHARMETLAMHTAAGSLTVADLRRLPTRYPFVAMLAQARFLERVADDAGRFPSFELVLQADARSLIEEDGMVRGVRYVDGEQNEREVRAELTVATDGRASRMRRAAKLEAYRSAPEIDVLWFRMPRLAGQVGGGYLAAGGYMIVLDRDEQWQVGFVIKKGRYTELRAAGIDSLRETIRDLAPPLAESADSLTDWKQIRLLSVQADRLRQWYRPGLLMLGDAAHVMSPVGGVGINYAIQDAVEAANRLVEPLNSGNVSTADLRAIQRARQGPTRLIQWIQAFDQRHLIEAALQCRGRYRLPLWLKMTAWLPGLRQLPSRVFAFGMPRVRVRH